MVAPVAGAAADAAVDGGVAAVTRAGVARVLRPLGSIFRKGSVPSAVRIPTTVVPPQISTSTPILVPVRVATHRRQIGIARGTRAERAEAGANAGPCRQPSGLAPRTTPGSPKTA